ncbi:hypothetical protein Hanom_Chr14g01247951 [Helianthus anomalus]
MVSWFLKTLGMSLKTRLEAKRPKNESEARLMVFLTYGAKKAAPQEILLIVVFDVFDFFFF